MKFDSFNRYMQILTEVYTLWMEVCVIYKSYQLFSSFSNELSILFLLFLSTFFFFNNCATPSEPLPKPYSYLGYHSNPSSRSTLFSLYYYYYPPVNYLIRFPCCHKISNQCPYQLNFNTN